MSMHTAPPCTCDTCPQQSFTPAELRAIWLADKRDQPHDRTVKFCVACGRVVWRGRDLCPEHEAATAAGFGH